MRTRCRHGLFDRYLESSAFDTPEWTGVIHADRCLCGAYLSLGPASDTPEVMIEIRATDLAARRTWLTQSETQGWYANEFDHDFDACPSGSNAVAWERSQHVGWLARQICMHDEEHR